MKFCINNPASNYKMKIAAETQNRLRYMYLKKEKKTLVFLEQRKYWNLWTKISLLLFQMKSYVWESIGYSSHVFTSFDFPILNSESFPGMSKSDFVLLLFISNNSLHLTNSKIGIHNWWKGDWSKAYNIRASGSWATGIAGP